jgi:hypothetical protein
LVCHGFVTFIACFSDADGGTFFGVFVVSTGLEDVLDAGETPGGGFVVGGG